MTVLRYASALAFSAACASGDSAGSFCARRSSSWSAASANDGLAHILGLEEIPVIRGQHVVVDRFLAGIRSAQAGDRQQHREESDGHSGALLEAVARLLRNPSVRQLRRPSSHLPPLPRHRMHRGCDRLVSIETSVGLARPVATRWTVTTRWRRLRLLRTSARPTRRVRHPRCRTRSRPARIG